MIDQARIRELLLQWQERRQLGDGVSAEDQARLDWKDGTQPGDFIFRLLSHARLMIEAKLRAVDQGPDHLLKCFCGPVFSLIEIVAEEVEFSR